MASERTLAIIKPDAVAKGVFGEAVLAIEKAGLKVVAVKRITLTRRQAEGFYAVHRERPFYADLTAFMSSGPSIVMVLEGDGAIGRWRELLGATDPAQAAPGTLRQRFGENIQNNGFHGSDAPDTAAFEIGFMFSGLELA